MRSTNSIALNISPTISAALQSSPSSSLSSPTNVIRTLQTSSATSPATSPAPTPPAASTTPTSSPSATSALGTPEPATSPSEHALVAGGAAAERAVGGWLMGCAAWVWALVVLGGVTRLTRSGLSMTDWKFGGEQAPRSEEEWAGEFDKYQQSPGSRGASGSSISTSPSAHAILVPPCRVNSSMTVDEFKFIYWMEVNSSMTVDEFKFIYWMEVNSSMTVDEFKFYWMEYAHRMWGRALGLLFLLPAAYFAARCYIKTKLAARCTVLFGLRGAQGLMGWWMVKSILVEHWQRSSPDVYAAVPPSEAKKREDLEDAKALQSR
ncbi:unnamed protein product [Closterium sp. Naga37s-1]|nr:unnamed protein product [Closterium sp. Naga37s-1]